jgi:hypothetical protein
MAAAKIVLEPIFEADFLPTSYGFRPGLSAHHARLPLEDTVENVNHAVRGWGNYFRYGNSGEKFSQIDSYAHERLAILRLSYGRVRPPKPADLQAALHNRCYRAGL